MFFFFFCEPKRYDNDRCEDRFDDGKYNDRGSKCDRRNEDSSFECGTKSREPKCEDKRSEHGRREEYSGDDHQDRCRQPA